MENTKEKEPSLKREKADSKTIEILYQEKKEELSNEELEKRELLKAEENIIKKKLEEEIAKITKLSPSLADEAKKKAIQIKSLDEKGKLKHLLDLAKINGTAFAVAVAKKMNDPYILDILHDILAREGLYKKFKK